MKKKIISILIGLIFSPILAHAAQFSSGEQVFVNDKIDDDLYIGGIKSTINNNIDGDLIIGGIKVKINSKIKEDLNVIAAQLSINGEVGDDVRIAGGEVQINGNIKGDLFVASETLDILEGAIIFEDSYLLVTDISINGNSNGDMKIFGNNVYFNGKIKGNVNFLNVNNIQFGPKAKIQGNLSYRSASKIDIPKGVVQGKIHYKNSIIKDDQKKILSAIYQFPLFSFFSSLMFGLFILWIFRYGVIQSVKTSYESPLKNIGIGILIIILVPIVALIFLFTSIGIPLAIILLCIWMILLYFGKIMAAMLIGFKILKNDKKSPFVKSFVAFGLGDLLYTLVGMLPRIGPLINLIIILMALGGIVTYKLYLFNQLRQKKLI